jgi:hypothetical protein
MQQINRKRFFFFFLSLSNEAKRHKNSTYIQYTVNESKYLLYAKLTRDVIITRYTCCLLYAIILLYNVFNTGRMKNNDNRM